MKKMNWPGVLGFLLWAPIPWLYLEPPAILAGQPLAVYAVALFLGGLSLTSTALYIALQKRKSPGLARVYVTLFILAFVGAYQFSGLATQLAVFWQKAGSSGWQSCRSKLHNNLHK